MTKTKDRSGSKELRVLRNAFGGRHVRVVESLGDGIFLTNKNAVGCVYRLDSGIYDEPLTVKQLENKIASYEILFRNILPGIPFGKSNVVIQVNCSQRRKTNFSYIEPVNNIARFLSDEERYVTSQGLIERSIYISVLMEVKDDIIESIKERIELGITEDELAFVKKIHRSKMMLHEELQKFEIDTDLKITRMTCEEVIAYYNSVLNFGEECPVKITATATDSFNQRILNEPMYGSGRGLQSFDDPNKNIRAFSFTHLPDEFAFGRLKTFLDQLPTAWDMVWTMSHGRTEPTTELKAKLGWFSVGSAVKNVKNDLDSFLANIGPLQPYGRLSLRLVAYNLDKHSERHILKSAIKYLRVPLVLDEEIGPHLISLSLPLNCNSEQNSITGRFHLKRLAVALGFLPIYDGYKGTGYRILRSTRGFETRYDRFSGEQNRTTVTLGETGGGKSVGNGFDILEFLARFPDGVVRVVDYNTSYDRLAEMVGGVVVKFSESFLRENPYSPFAIDEWENEDIELIVSFMAACITRINPDARFGSDHSEILVEALRLCINTHYKDREWAAKNPARAKEIAPHFTWMQVLEKLEPAADAKDFEGAMSAVDEIRQWAISFSETGQFGFLFSSHEKPDRYSSGNRLIVYDLAGISDERLQSIASQLVALKIVRDLKKLSRRIQKNIVFEELGVYLRGESESTQKTSNQLVLKVVKTVRKLNGIPHGITNGVEEFFETIGGKAFWSQASRRIFYPMSDDIVKSLAEKAPDLTEADIDIIGSLKMVDGEYTQAYIIIRNGKDLVKVVVEVPLSPNAGALLITSGSVAAHYDELRAAGNDVHEALKIVADTIGRKMKCCV